MRRAVLLTSPDFDETEIEQLRDCFASGWVTQGPLTERFEELVARHHRAAHAIATTSATAALHLCTAALGLGDGDDVVVPAFTWITSANAAEYVGARAVFVDVSPETFNVDVDALEAAITPRTKAIIAVHLFGLAAEMDDILAVARRHGLEAVVAPVRPSWKERYPLTPIERYASWTRADGLPFDPWMRVHARLGADVLKPEAHSLRITGTVADWERWTEMAFPESGEYVFPRGLATLAVDREEDVGTYWEPNVWMRHAVGERS